MAKCFKCEGTGKWKEPVNKEIYDIVFNRFDSQGATMEEAREKALRKAGYNEIICPCCNGTGEE